MILPPLVHDSIGEFFWRARLRVAEEVRLRLTLLAPILCCGILQANAAEPTLQRVTAAKAVTLGFIKDQAPFASIGSNGLPEGYSIDLCGMIVEEIEKRVGDVETAFLALKLDEAFDAVSTRRVTLLCGATTITLDRRELVDFSEPIFLTGAAGLLRADSPSDLRELFLGERAIRPPRSGELRPFARSRIGVRDGSTTETALKAAVSSGGYNSEVVTFEGHAEALAALEARQIDAYVADQALLAKLQGSARNPRALVLGSRLFTNEQYGLALQRGDPDFRLLVDRILSTFFLSDEFPQFFAAHFGQESSALRAEIQALSLRP